MAKKKSGAQTIVFPSAPRIAGWASVVGPKEGQGPLGKTFDRVLDDDLMGQESWEKAECQMLSQAADLAMKKAGIAADGIDIMLGGDLLNQIISASFAARSLARPYLGLYGACSTMAESLLLGAMALDGEYADCALCCTCSHFSTAERQYRFPLELGNQRQPSSQWTVTGAGAAILQKEGPIQIVSATIGKVEDLGIKDQDNMGAAMAPAAADTLLRFFADTGMRPQDVDLIVSGDLGMVGQTLTRQLCLQQGLSLDERYIDCGSCIFAPDQDAHSGGSGCGCSASVLNGWLLGRMMDGEIRRMLFMATGALLSPTTVLQGETIPGIAHAVLLEKGVV